MNYLKMTGYIVRTASDNWTLGYEGENNARTLRVKTTDSLTNFATVNLLIDTLDCGAMTIQTVSNYRILEMVITEEMLGLPGLKTCQLVMKNTAGSVVLKTNQFYMYVKSSNVTDRIYISTEDTIKAALTALINDGVLEDLSIEDGSITTAKIANGAITQAKLDPNISFEADDELDATSTNAIQNKVVTAAISEVNESLGEKVPYPKESGAVVYPSEDSNLVIHPDGSVGYGTKTPIPSLPVLNLYGDMTGITKENRVNLKYAYVDEDNHEQFTGWLDAKLQGDSSLLYPKKNYTFRFYHDPSYRRKDKINFFEMTKQSKWVVKANYMDHSHARNIVSARLWADIVHSRNTAPPELLTGSPNNGAINGYPIKIYLNGQYFGLYTLNIPKDDFTFGMDAENPLHCCAYGQANNNGDTTTTAGVVLSNEFRLADTIGWECEVPGSYTNDTRAGLVALINFVMTSTDEEFKDGLDAYLDVESMLDYYAFCYFIGASDSLAQNMILLTYDGGTKWYCSAYDLDSTFGIYYNGGRFYPYNMACPEDYQDTNSLLWQRVEANFGTELYERYTSLRETVLSVDYVTRAFRQFMSLISDDDYEEDVTRWAQTPQKNVDHFEQITTWISQRAPYVDARIAEIAGEYEAATVTYNLTNVISSNSTSEAAMGGSYITTLSTYGGASISSVSVIMDFVDVTSSVYSNGVINISNVTGSIIITASASDGTLLYALPSAFTGNGSSAYIDTNVMLFDTNKDFSIVYTVRNTSNSAGSGKLFTCHNWMVVEQGSTSKRDVGLIVDGYNQCRYEGNSFYTYINPNQTAKVVLTHVGGSNVLTRRRVASNGESQNDQMTGTYPFVSRNRTVIIGCDRSEYNETPNSFLSNNVTLDDFKIYGRVLNSEEIESYVTF